MALQRLRPAAFTLLAALATVPAAPVHAEAPAHGAWLLGLSPLGASVGYGMVLSDRWSGRLYVNSGSLSHLQVNDVRLGSSHWDVNGRIGAGISALADYAPWSDSGWHLTTGLVLAQAQPRLTARADAGGGFTINGHHYAGAEVGTLSGRLRRRPLSGYLGGGWDSKPAGEPGWRFTSDLGLIVSPRSRASLAASAGVGNAALQADVAAEQRRLDRWGAALVLQLGAAFAF